MDTAVVTTKGQIVIPSNIRKKHNITKGTRLSIIEKGDQIILEPLTDDYFEKMAGILKTKGKLGRMLSDERSKEKAREDKKW